MPSTTVLLLLTLADLLGVVANAFLGGIAARRARLDVIGFVTVAVASGLGGGMIRDALLARGPAAALVNPWYLVVASAGALMAYLLPVRGRMRMRLLVILDAVSVGCWAGVGVQKGLAAELPWLAAIMLGVITAVGGGMVRDLLLQRRPAILGGNTLYATGAVVAAFVALLGTLLGHPVLASWAAIAVGAAIVIAARRWRWVLPTARSDD